MAARAALGRAFLASGATIFGLGAATMLVSSVSMGVARVVVTQKKKKTAVPCGICQGAKRMPCDVCSAGAAAGVPASGAVALPQQQQLPQLAQQQQWEHGEPHQRREPARGSESCGAASLGLFAAVAPAPGQQQLLRGAARLRQALRRRWSLERLTAALAAASVVPALALALAPLAAAPPGVAEAAGSAAAAAAADPASWQGPLRDMFSFTVLLSVFVCCEPGAAAAAAVSAAGAALALLAEPEVLPPVAGCTAAALAATAAAVLVLAAATLQRRPERRGWRPEAAMLRVQQALGVLGGGLLAQFGASLVTADGGAAAGGWLLAVAGGAAAVLAARAALPRLLAASAPGPAFWEDWPAWSATLLLILQPLHQLVASALAPAQLLPGVSPGQQALLVLAAGLQVPRALLMRELMWFTGTASAAQLAAAQLLVCGAHGAAARAAALHRQPWVAAGGAADASGSATLVVGVLALAGAFVALRAGWRSIARRSLPSAGASAAS
ncbi:maltose excess protein 1 [Scenedesmus sp. PABB004]|nr:maltose excess protein 1 [Scenedesmus sp. PABB004]